MQALNAKKLEKRDEARRLFPVLRRRMNRVYDIVSAFLWYQKQRASREKSELFVPPDRLPPMALRQRVNGLRDIYSFLAIGKRCCEDIEEGLRAAGRELDSFSSILDFGCGCGRTLLWLDRKTRDGSLHGSDSDERAIRWCRQHLPFARFATNGPFPPLDYPDDHFDLVLVISLFTHFDEDSQNRWLEELERVIARGGLMVATFHGRYCWEDYAHLRPRLEAEGFANVHVDPSWPPYFQATYHSEEYVRREFGKRFDVLEYLPRGLNDHQDLAVLRKP